jgi:hypothetical protein
MQIITRKEAQAQGLRRYFTGKPCKRGHVDEHRVNGGCLTCIREKDRNAKREQRLRDPEGARERDRNRVRPRTDEIRAKEAKRREVRRPHRRTYFNRYQSERRRTDPQYRVRCALAGRVLTAIRRQYGDKAAKTMELIGCSVSELMAHLEAQFLPGMTWDNHAIDGWHIDHIVPCASFDLTDPVQQRACFHWSNLQPLWAFDNIVKGDKLAA